MVYFELILLSNYKLHPKVLYTCKMFGSESYGQGGLGGVIHQKVLPYKRPCVKKAFSERPPFIKAFSKRPLQKGLIKKAYLKKASFEKAPYLKKASWVFLFWML